MKWGKPVPILFGSTVSVQHVLYAAETVWDFKQGRSYKNHEERRWFLMWINCTPCQEQKTWSPNTIQALSSLFSNISADISITDGSLIPTCESEAFSCPLFECTSQQNWTMHHVEFHTVAATNCTLHSTYADVLTNTEKVNYNSSIISIRYSG